MKEVFEMGKKITIKRKKQFAAAAIKCFVALNLEINEFDHASEKVFTLTNGRTIVLETTAEKNSFFIVAFTSAGKVFSEIVVVDEHDHDAKYFVAFKMGILRNKFDIDKM